jgi:hypothetical protein
MRTLRKRAGRTSPSLLCLFLALTVLVGDAVGTPATSLGANPNSTHFGPPYKSYAASNRTTTGSTYENDDYLYPSGPCMTTHVASSQSLNLSSGRIGFSFKSSAWTCPAIPGPVFNNSTGEYLSVGGVSAFNFPLSYQSGVPAYFVNGTYSFELKLHTQFGKCQNPLKATFKLCDVISSANFGLGSYVWSNATGVISSQVSYKGPSVSKTIERCGGIRFACRDIGRSNNTTLFYRGSFSFGLRPGVSMNASNQYFLYFEVSDGIETNWFEDTSHLVGSFARASLEGTGANHTAVRIRSITET